MKPPIAESTACSARFLVY